MLIYNNKHKNFLSIVCPPGYENLFKGSENCFKIVAVKESWEAAKEKCQDDNAMLACFGSQEERDHIANLCDGCWVGYKYLNSKY